MGNASQTTSSRGSGAARGGWCSHPSPGARLPVTRGSGDGAAVFDRRQPEAGVAVNATGHGPPFALIEPAGASGPLKRPEKHV